STMLLNLRKAGGPLYRRVYLALKAKIRTGSIGPATRVPSTRALARDLGVSRNTVMLAYEQLAAEGYLVSRHRGATSVAGVAEPHYPGATIPFEAVGARLLRVPVDAGGLDVAKLPSAVERPRLAYVTPCHQFPSGVIMPLERRLALLQWASRVGAWVVEDDYV